MPAFDFELEFLGKDELAGGGPGAVTGHADEIESKRKFEVADEIGEEHDRAVEKGDDDEVAPGVIAGDGASESAHALLDFVGRDEDTLDFVLPGFRNIL